MGQSSQRGGSRSDGAARALASARAFAQICAHHALVPHAPALTLRHARRSLQSFFGWGPAANVDIVFKDQKKLRKVQMLTEGDKSQTLFLFPGAANVAGTVVVSPKKRKLEHLGVKIELLGHIELLYDRGNPYEHLQIVKELDSAGAIMGRKEYKFEFNNVNKQYETYEGHNVRLRYFLRVKITRHMAYDITKTLDFAVQNVQPDPEINNSIKMEVGIEDCLHIEFEYNKMKYHLDDVVVGKIFFLLVRIKIKHMEVVIIRRESTGSGPNTYSESENIATFEIMDGAPVRGESIPIRLFLAPYNLSPTMKNVENKFTVRYYLNLVLVDEENRRYFKQQEIILRRKKLSGARIKSAGDAKQRQ